jgi:hypothetical protein
MHIGAPAFKARESVVALTWHRSHGIATWRRHVATVFYAFLGNRRLH